MENLKEKIKTLRARMEWSQEELARQIDVSLSTVQRWESKDVKPVKPVRLAQRELNKLFKKAGLNK